MKNHTNIINILLVIVNSLTHFLTLNTSFFNSSASDFCFIIGAIFFLIGIFVAIYGMKRSTYWLNLLILFTNIFYFLHFCVLLLLKYIGFKLFIYEGCVLLFT
ncbi:TPA: hypothetical protein ACRUCH_001369 [Staphylococcus aureus]|uniref:hypothetical protein n=1 Tax=Staphylococcus aureus TaxID=1280 RepID=UPI00099187D2|nr:hypothetical protein [Staphylococcus aureus]PZG61380.1 hypothetical protein C7R42_11800 [Staphylococcus aureus]PZH16311.1 hypothetical protein C7Q91_12775 [Staphylococcus aureus]